MLKGRNGSSSSGPEKIFAGVRFVLFGFDSVSEAQYRSELVRRGGIDVGRYDSSCTHVIVSGRVYDDPVCVAALQDGKTLVTELWIDDSVDHGTLADANRVLYRPIKDLNGIPGSESLYICLTGYQRQERDDIMKMVSLMGARFTKPLIANQVTHLICYKFEGEKYELAKKVKIKLVNHRWLEECLKAWEILPIDNYTKSGWELEVLEAEARDSEEETDDAGMELLGQRSTGGASSLRHEIPVPAGSHLSTLNNGMFSIHQEASTANPSHATENLLMSNRLSSTPHKESSLRKTLDLHNLSNNVEFGHRDAGGIAQASDGFVISDAAKHRELSIPRGAYLEKECNTFSSSALTTKMGSPSSGGDERFSTPSCLRKTPKKLSTPEELSNKCTSHQGNMEENIFKGNLDISKSALREERTNCEPADFRSPTSCSGALPQKRKVTVLRIGSKSPKSEGQNSRLSPPQSSCTDTRSAQLEPTSAMSINHGLTDMNNSFKGAAISNSKENQHDAPSKFKALSYKKRSLKCGQPTSETKISSSADSPSNESKTGLPRNTHPRQASDEPMDIKNKFPVLETRIIGAVVSPDDGQVLSDLPLDGEPGNEINVDISLGNTASILESLVINGKSKDETPFKEKTPETSFGGSREPELAAKPMNGGDIAMKDMPNLTVKGTGQPQSIQEVEGVLSPVSRDSETRKLSITASTNTCKENANKAASGVGTKVVARRNLRCKPKLTTGNTSKDRSVTSSDKTVTPSKTAVKLGKVGKAKAQPEFEKATNNEKKDTVMSVPKDVVMEDKVNLAQHHLSESSSKNKAMDWMEVSMDPEKENKPKKNGILTSNVNSHPSRKVVCKDSKKSRQRTKAVGGVDSNAEQTSSCARGLCSEPVWFILSGHRFQRKEFQTVIRRLRGRLCRDSHNWSYQATHFIAADPVRRTEKFFAAAAAGRWILKTEYLTASNEAGKFLDEEPFEWYRNGLSEDGAISLEAPRKWRLLRERTGHGAFYGMRIIIYGECIAPTLDTLKRVVKAGDGSILATSPPYTRFLNSGVDYAIVSPSMPRVDSWVQEFLRHEIPCVVADYLVEYVCKPGYSLERHVLYKTYSWAEKSFANLLSRSEEKVTDALVPSEESSDDLSCSVCGSRDRGEVMLICGDEAGAVGCGIGTHIDCCDPPLEAVPEGDWFCPECSSSRELKTPFKGNKIKSSSKCK